MPGNTQYECCSCRHSFGVPEGAVRDTRLLMCPACGSIDLNLTWAPPVPLVVWTSEAVLSWKRTEGSAKIAS